MAETVIVVANAVGAIQTAAESQGLGDTANPSSVLSVTVLLLAFDLFSDLWLGYESIGIAKELASEYDPFYYRCRPNNCKVRTGVEFETKYRSDGSNYTGINKIVYESCGQQEPQPFCTCEDDLMWEKWPNEVKGCHLSEQGIEQMEISCQNSKGYLFGHYNETTREHSENYNVTEMDLDCEDRSFLTKDEWSSRYSAKGIYWPQYILREICGCHLINLDVRVIVKAAVIAIGSFFLVGFAIVRELIRITLILYNLLMTIPHENAKFQRWIAESPFLIIFWIFHPTKWQDMSELKVSDQKFLASTGMLINIFTQDLLAIALDIAILRNPIWNGEIRGEGNPIYPIVSLVASILMLLYNTYVIRRINSESRRPALARMAATHNLNTSHQFQSALTRSRSMSSTRRLSLVRMASANLHNMTQRLLTPRNILLFSNIWALVDFGVEVSLFHFVFSSRLSSFASRYECEECLVGTDCRETYSCHCTKYVGYGFFAGCALYDCHGLGFLYDSNGEGFDAGYCFWIDPPDWETPPFPGDPADPRYCDNCTEFNPITILKVSWYLSFVPASRELIQLMFVFRNICSSSNKLVRPGMVMESSLYPIFFYIFKPQLWKEMVEFSTHEPATTRNWILFKLMTQAVPYLVVGNLIIFHPYYFHFMSGASFEDNEIPVMAAVSVAVSLVTLMLSGFRLVLLNRIKKQGESTDGDDRDSKSSINDLPSVDNKDKDAAEKQALARDSLSEALDSTESVSSYSEEEEEDGRIDKHLVLVTCASF